MNFSVMSHQKTDLDRHNLLFCSISKQVSVDGYKNQLGHINKFIIKMDLQC